VRQCDVRNIVTLVESVLEMLDDRHCPYGRSQGEPTQTDENRY